MVEMKGQRLAAMWAVEMADGWAEWWAVKTVVQRAGRLDRL